MPLPSVAAMDPAHAVSREYHASCGRECVSQMDEFEDGYDGVADADLPERGSGVDADGEEDENGAEGFGECDADADAEIMDALDAAMNGFWTFCDFFLFLICYFSLPVSFAAASRGPSLPFCDSKLKCFHTWFLASIWASSSSSSFSFVLLV
ncbi:hypothetical protein DFH11DRAFT_1639328 [Phellopilus nigrolimitatus]|nr:hypothetical protein DFH11DRAFT_1642742 [Phellopilus nigrolimitatus]KAH8106640.1 hypothetical protein DFH11DRAFT_1639328 [Phellopilus nigrolimitatus]